MTPLSTLGSMNRKFEGYKYRNKLVFNSFTYPFAMNMTRMKMNILNVTLTDINRTADALSYSPRPDDSNENYVTVLQGCTIFLVLLILMIFVTQYRWLKVLKLRLTTETGKDNVAMETGLNVDEFDKLLSGEDITDEVKLLLHRLLSIGRLNRTVQMSY